MTSHHGSVLRSEDSDDPTEATASRAVVVLTPELIKQMEAEELANRPPNATMSALSDSAVQGYPSDEKPNELGYFDLRYAVGLLHGDGIDCCLVQEPASVYYGSTRMIWDFVLCVPDDKLAAAEALFSNRPNEFEPFRPLPMVSRQYLDGFFPRFKFVGISLFLVILPSRASHLKCCSENIEYSAIGLPYPRLPVYVQSLLDTLNRVDLTDVIDGMNLTPEWGETNLTLDGTVDPDWGRWAADLRASGKAREDQIPNWCRNPPKRRDLWMEASTTESKLKRQGIKRFPGYETKYWRTGQKDPRSRWERLAKEEKTLPPGSMRTLQGE
jgi:hypothetical protein